MPRLSCFLIKASLAHLGVGIVMGGLILSAKGFPALLNWAWLLLPAHIQMMIGGWMIQLTLGVAYWILPRLHPKGTRAGDRGSPGWAWSSFGALNVGVVGAALMLIARSFWREPWVDALLAIAAVLQVVALAAFARHAWPRVQLVTASASA